MTVLVGLLMLGIAPALLFGFTLGRVRAWPVLVVSAVSGAVVLLIDFAALAALSDPNVKTEDPVAAFVASYLFTLLPFIECPLVASAGFGALCRSWRNERRRH
ncbi:hypothetical protein [Kitasatospora sp. GP82]|uniref:hypothetical protein n=1 Tax=Kitasatospora sp. GP82 TaxID=3035089 RepID=UPI002473A05A|nr:hypothetical protein [Kitasatospora sp. GP82]